MSAPGWSAACFSGQSGTGDWRLAFWRADARVKSADVQTYGLRAGHVFELVAFILLSQKCHLPRRWRGQSEEVSGKHQRQPLAGS